MHELPVIEDVLRVSAEEAAARGLKKIRSITLVIGELSSVVDESAQMYFELLAEGTACEGAELKFRHVPAKLRCTACGHEFDHDKGFDCPRCASQGFLIKGTGRELYIEKIDGE